METICLKIDNFGSDVSAWLTYISYVLSYNIADPNHYMLMDLCLIGLDPAFRALSSKKQICNN